MANNKERFYIETKFGGFTDIDGTIAFFIRVNSLIKNSFVILDVGCGRGEYQEDPITFRKNLRILRGKAAKVIGIDIDHAAMENPFIDEFHLINDNIWPIENNSVDLIICDNVLEHIENTNKFFKEIHRVLKKNGLICIRTPNRWNYIALAATIIPSKYHSKVISVVQKGRHNKDIFPTYYRCNSIIKLKKILKRNGIECVVYGYEAEPSYLSFSTFFYCIGFLHQRFAPSFLKQSIFAFGTKTNLISKPPA